MPRIANIIIATLLLSSCAGSESLRNAPVHILAFDCLVPIPSGMVFSSKSRSQVLFYSAEPSDLTQIVLNSPPIEIEKLYRRVELRSFDTFRLERWTLLEPRGNPEIDNLAVLTNDETAIYVYAEPRDLASEIAEVCSENLVGH